MHLRSTVVLMCALTGCASAPSTFDLPVLVHGTVGSPVWTHWIRDYCDAGRPVEFDTFDCSQLGGEIHSATLTNVRIVNGPRLRRSLKVAFVGHALGQSYSESMFLVLVQAPPDFRAATGLEYFVGDRDNYDAKEKCIDNNGYSHMDFRDCPDQQFHETHAGCISVTEYLSHYAHQP
jgi:hypothetical protein